MNKNNVVIFYNKIAPHTGLFTYFAEREPNETIHQDFSLKMKIL